MVLNLAACWPQHYCPTYCIQPKPSIHCLACSIIYFLTLSIHSHSPFKPCLITPQAKAWFIDQLKWVWKSTSCLKWKACTNVRKGRNHWCIAMWFIKMGLWEEAQSHSTCSFREQKICKGGRKKKERGRQGGRLHLHSRNYCEEIYSLLICPLSHLVGLPW